MCSGSTEVPERHEGCWQPPHIPSSCRNVPGWAAAAGWGWDCVLSPVGLKQPPVLRRPQTPDLDVLTCCLSLFSSCFYQKSLRLEAQTCWHCMGILPKMVPACGSPSSTASFPRVCFLVPSQIYGIILAIKRLNKPGSSLGIDFSGTSQVMFQAGTGFLRQLPVLEIAVQH